MPAPSGADLGAALHGLRAALAQARFPLETAGAAAAREAARALSAQLEDYLIPRVARLESPVLAVVGGSTGAGKSTLVNSLVRAPVSPAGVLRPTTRGPVLVCHPSDAAWFGGSTLLPGLPRASAPGEGVLQVVSAPSLAPGLALLDAPDIDSVVARNREVAGELLAAADLWLFVTTAARYADAVPWGVLRGARDRGTVVAVVLDRVPPAVREDVAADLGRLLSEQGLPGAPLFVVDESTLDRHGLLPAGQVAPIEGYLTEVASNEVRRRGVTRRTLIGAVAAAAATADDLAWVTAEQVSAAEALAETGREAYRWAISTVEQQLHAGAVLRGGVYARWRESVASGEVNRALRAAQDPTRARPAPVTPGRALHAAIATAVAALLVEVETLAAAAVVDRWREDPVGRTLLLQESADIDAGPAAMAAGHLVRDWQAWLRQEARAGASSVRTRTRGTATAATVLLATVAAIAPTDDPALHATGASAQPAAVDALRRVLATEPVARLGERARAELFTRIEEHLTASARRWRDRVDRLGIDERMVAHLRSVAAEVGVARQLTHGLGRAA